ncbi:MAG: hypothetical protein WBC22_16865 [Sedimentisphaerales bacterium]
MEEKFIKRGYYFPEKLLDEWKNFHAPGKDYSPSAAGAFLVWMGLDSTIREEAKKKTLLPNLKKAVREVQKLLNENAAIELSKIEPSFPQKRRRVREMSKKEAIESEVLKIDEVVEKMEPPQTELNEKPNRL